MWKQQVNLGMIPYYMFVARDTGAQSYFGLTLEQAHHIFNQAYQQVSGICRTVRGPSMSAGPGKVRIIGITEEKRYLHLNFCRAETPIGWASHSLPLSIPRHNGWTTLFLHLEKVNFSMSRSTRN